MKLKDIVFIALFTALITVCAQISIPTTLPFTMQTFAIFLTCALLRDKRCFFAVGIYVLMGVLGLPVFSGFKGGMGVIASATGGYILGFLVIPIVMVTFFKLFKFNVFALIGSMVLGLSLCYILGSVWFALVYTSESLSFWEILKLCVIPYLLADSVKILLAVILSVRLLAIRSVREYLGIKGYTEKKKGGLDPAA